MSDGNGSKPQSVPAFLTREEFWMICSRWDEVIQEQVDPMNLGKARKMVRRTEVNEVTNKHPILHAALRSTAMKQDGKTPEFLHYAITAMIPISRQHYEWVMNMQPAEQLKREVDQIAKKLTDDKGV